MEQQGGQHREQHPEQHSTTQHSLSQQAEAGTSGEANHDSATLDAIQLMLRDLHTRHDEIRHRAAFRGCTKELLEVQQELVNYLLAKKSALSGQNGSGSSTYHSFV